MVFVLIVMFQAPTAPLQYPSLAANLSQMTDEDQAVRQFFVSGLTQDKEKLAAEIKKVTEVDHRDTERMKWIVAKFGWPTPLMVGKEASNNAWFLVQHADSYHPFQKLCLNLIEPLSKSKVISGGNFAYLYDRVQLGDGKPQRFGTQRKNENGVLWIGLVENPEKVDEYRKQYGLMPLADDVKLLTDAYNYKLAPLLARSIEADQKEVGI